jgi:CHAT domain-containing protein/tetratricopeptide (TPR) repeat protein
MPTCARPLAGQQADTVRAQPAIVLRLNQLITVSVRGGEQQQFELPASAGQYLSVSVEQDGINLVIMLADPAGRQLLEVTRLGSTLVPEPVVAVTGSAGVYKLTVRAQSKDAPVGRCQVQLEEQRTAAVQDENRASALRATARGGQLQFGAGTADALRRALTEYETAYKDWQAAGEPREMARTLGNLGTTYSSLRDYQNAINRYKAEADLLHSLDAAKQEASVAATVGWLYYHELRDQQQALAYLARALKRYEAADARVNAARTRTIIGMVYIELGVGAVEQRKSLAYLTAALADERELANPYAEGNVLSNLMIAWQKLQRPATAIFYGKQAVNIYQSLRTQLKELALEQDTQQTFLRSKADTYRTLADLLITEGHLPEAQQVLNMLKEEEYSELLLRGSNDAGGGGGNGGTPSPAPMTPAELEWQKRYEEVADQVTLRGRERGQLLSKPVRTAEDDKRLSVIDSQLSLAHQAFERFLDRMTNELGDTKQAARVETFREAEGLAQDLRELGGRAVALYTLVGADKYRIILITPDVQRAYEYPITGADLARKVAAFRQVLQDPHRDPVPLAQELYKIVVGPVAKDLVDAQAETLMWSLDGVLRYVPMAALHDGQQYLVDKYRNEVFTTASMARLKDMPAQKWKGLGFGVSKAQTGFNALPAVPQELHAIFRDETASGADAVGGVIPGKIMLDNAFTLDSLKLALRQQYPVVHIASHFAFRPGSDNDSFLLLGDGSHFSLGQIKNESNLFGGVELLTLSACDTANGGPGADGKEVDGLGMVAQRQGAKAVIASLWPVADASTQLLMQKFYEIRDANAGMPKAEALRQAQLTLLHGPNKAVVSDNRSRGLADEMNRGMMGDQAPGSAGSTRSSFAHPFFWAPFTLIGNWK